MSFERYAAALFQKIGAAIVQGKAVATLVPMPATADLFGAMSDSVMFVGDIVSPLDNDWEAAQQ